MPKPASTYRIRDWNTLQTDSAWEKELLKIGHGGASGHAAANSLASLQLALDMGVDMVEFDVRPCRDALVLVHDDSLRTFHYPDIKVSQCTLDELRSLIPDEKRRIVTLQEALEVLKDRALINVDLKAAGYEIEVHEIVKAKGLVGAVLYSSVIASSLLRLRQFAPGIKLGLSYPEDKGDASSKAWLKPVVHTILAGMRLTLPLRILGMMASAQANAVMLYHKVVSPQVVRTVQQAGGKVFTWTVDDPRRMEEMRAMGVNGITSNYPDRLDSHLGA